MTKKRDCTIAPMSIMEMVEALQDGVATADIQIAVATFFLGIVRGYRLPPSVPLLPPHRPRANATAEAFIQ